MCRTPKSFVAHVGLHETPSAWEDDKGELGKGRSSAGPQQQSCGQRGESSGATFCYVFKEISRIGRRSALLILAEANWSPVVLPMKGFEILPFHFLNVEENGDIWEPPEDKGIQ